MAAWDVFRSEGDCQFTVFSVKMSIQKQMDVSGNNSYWECG